MWFDGTSWHDSTTSPWIDPEGDLEEDADEEKCVAEEWAEDSGDAEELAGNIYANAGHWAADGSDAAEKLAEDAGDAGKWAEDPGDAGKWAEDPGDAAEWAEDPGDAAEWAEDPGDAEWAEDPGDEEWAEDARDAAEEWAEDPDGDAAQEWADDPVGDAAGEWAGEDGDDAAQELAGEDAIDGEEWTGEDAGDGEEWTGEDAGDAENPVGDAAEEWGESGDAAEWVEGDPDAVHASESGWITWPKMNQVVPKDYPDAAETERLGTFWKKYVTPKVPPAEHEPQTEPKQNTQDLIWKLQNNTTDEEMLAILKKLKDSKESTDSSTAPKLGAKSTDEQAGRGRAADLEIFPARRLPSNLRQCEKQTMQLRSNLLGTGRFGPRPNDLDFLEAFAGEHLLFSAAKFYGLRAHAIDVAYSRKLDVLTAFGFLVPEDFGRKA
ncbi:unnamed protein product [Symbiodinium sp. KB8]|nr:unnamed protein product [Symbiodinium sp. KB8]